MSHPSDTLGQVRPPMLPHRSHSTSTLQDAGWACGLGELPTHFAALDDRWAALGADDAVAMACPQSARAAVALLYLLERGRHVVLLPADLAELDGVIAGLRFCRFALTPNAAPAGESPADALTLAPNPGFDARRAPPVGDAPRFYVRTSGSMGEAKLVAYTHQALIGNARGCVERFELTASDRVALPVPLAHMYGLGAGFLPAMLAGASCEVIPNANLLRYMDRERAFEPDVAFLTPALCEMMVRRRRRDRPHRLVVTAGGRIAEETFRAFDRRFGPLVNLYGSSEMGAVAADPPGAAPDCRATGLGAPLPGVELRVVPDDDGGRTGELECHHPHGFAGYVAPDGAPLSTAPAWFSTRDRVERDGGALRVLGRIDNAANRAGRLVMFADIERALETLPTVRAAVVVRGPGETTRGPDLVAWCVPEPDGQPPSPAAIREACRRVLPTHCVPDTVHLLDTLPRLASGKPDRQQLTRMTLDPSSETP